MTEKPRLGITPEIVEKFEKQSKPFHRDISPFIKAIIAELEEEQPQLDQFIMHADVEFSIGDATAFSTAAVLTYKMIPEELRKNPITSKEMRAVRQKIRNCQKDTSIDLDVFLDLLSFDSPAFVQLLTEMANGLNEPNSKSDFILGGLFVALPFYIRAYANEDENKIF